MQNMGSALRNARKQKNITLMQLAADTDLSASFISKIERGINTPSFNTLQRICHALNISSADLLDKRSAVEQEPSSARIFRSRDRQLVYDYSNVVRFENIFTYSSKVNIEALIISGSRKDYTHSQHPHDEIGIVSKGTLLVTVDGEDFELEEGDCILIPSGILHKVQKLSQGECISYWVAIKKD